MSWKNERSRHSMAARGIKTNLLKKKYDTYEIESEYPNYVTHEANIECAEYLIEDTDLSYKLKSIPILHEKTKKWVYKELRKLKKLTGKEFILIEIESVIPSQSKYPYDSPQWRGGRINMVFQYKNNAKMTVDINDNFGTHHLAGAAFVNGRKYHYKIKNKWININATEFSKLLTD